MAEGRTGVPVLLAALEQGDEQVKQTARRWQRFIAVAIVLSCLLTIAYMVWALFELRDAWHTGEWTYFWDTMRGVWPLLAFGGRFVGFEDHFTAQADAARTIREAAIRGDEQDAPVAEENSQLSQGSSSTLFGGVSYGPLMRPRDGRSIGPIVVLCMAMFMAIVLGLILLVVGLSGAGEGTTQTEEIIGGILLLLLLLSVWMLVVVMRMRRGIIVMADDTGITWKQVGWRTQVRRIAWHEAQAFFIVTQRRSTNWAKDTTWLLMGASGALAWMAGPEATEPQADSPHARFAALVAARTRLPLRDLSALVDGMSKGTPISEQRKAAIENATRAYEETKREILAARTHPEQAEAWLSARKSEQATEAWLAAREREQTPKSSGLGWGCTVQLVLVLVIGLVAAGGWGLQQYQPHYYAGVLAQIHASKPLYHDDLSHDNGDWPLCTPTTNNPDRCSYSEQSYHLASVSGRFVSAWTDQVYGSAVVEGTVREIGATENNGVGLILRAYDNNTYMTVFYIHPTDGTWTLSQYHDVGRSPDDNWTDLDFGYSRAIRTAPGAANDLLVIMNGDRYICYINGTVVQTYDDSTHAAPGTGHVGLYVNDGATEGVFTNFTVYPTPPPSIWSAL